MTAKRRGILPARLFQNQVSFFKQPWQIFILDAFFLLGLWASWGSAKNLTLFTQHQASIDISTYTMVIFGMPFLYGIRIATYIAMIRKNRPPQTLEWIVTLFGFAGMAFFLVFGVPLLILYGKIYGYELCHMTFMHGGSAYFQPSCAPS
jgi:hypothetical protein